MTQQNESKFEKGLKIAGKVLTIATTIVAAATQINNTTQKSN